MEDLGSGEWPIEEKRGDTRESAGHLGYYSHNTDPLHYYGYYTDPLYYYGYYTDPLHYYGYNGN